MIALGLIPCKYSTPLAHCRAQLITWEDVYRGAGLVGWVQWSTREITIKRNKFFTKYLVKMIQTCVISWSLSKDNDYDDVCETSLKKWIHAVSIFIALIPRCSICQMLVNVLELNSTRLMKGNRKSLSCNHVLQKTWNYVSCRSCAVRTKKCTKKCDAQAKLVLLI